MNLNIRNKLIIFAALLIFIPLSLSGISILFLVRSSIDSNARKSIEKDARLAEKIFNSRRQVIKEISQNLAQAIAAENLLESAQTPANPSSPSGDAAATAQQSQVRGLKRLQELLERRAADVDFIVVTDISGRVLLRSNGAPTPGETMKDNPLVLDTLNKLESRQPEAVAAATQASPVKEDAEVLKRLGLDQQAKMRTSDGQELSTGLAVEGVAPITAGESRLGLVVAGLLVNNAREDRSVPSEIKRALYPELQDKAATSILLDQVIVSTTFPNEGQAARGLQLKRKLPSDKPEAYTDLVGNTEYRTAYMPLKSVDSKIVGYVGVAIQESYFSEIVNTVLYLIIGIVLFFLAVAVGAAAVISQRLTQPIIQLTEAADRISLGELDVAITTSTGDEIGKLAESLERMRTSLKQAIERLRRR